MEKQFRPSQEEVAFLHTASNRYQQAADRLNSYLGRVNPDPMLDHTILSETGDASFALALEVDARRLLTKQIPLEVYERVERKRDQVSKSSQAIRSAAESAQAYLGLNGMLRPDEETHLSDQFIEMITDLPKSVADKILDPRETQAQEIEAQAQDERARLAVNIKIVSHSKAEEAKIRAGESALPMDEQDAMLNMALVWEDNFAMLDRWTQSYGLDPVEVDKEYAERLDREAQAEQQEDRPETKLDVESMLHELYSRNNPDNINNIPFRLKEMRLMNLHKNII